MNSGVSRALAGADLPSRAQIALRERPLVDVLDLAVRFCAAHAAAYAKLSLVIVLPAYALCYAACRAGGWWLGWSVAIALAALADAPFVVLASRLVFADRVRTRDAARIAGVALPGIVGARLAQLGALVASVSLMRASLALGRPARLLPRRGHRARAGRGPGCPRTGGADRQEPLRRDAERMVLLLLVARLAFTPLADLAGREVLSEVFEVKPPRPMLEVGGSWLALAGWWPTAPIGATARFFVYVDIRTRTEGWDIQTRFAAIAANGGRP